MRPTRSAGPSAIYANILVNSSQQTLISFFEATLGNENEARPPNPTIQRMPTSAADFDCYPLFQLVTFNS